MDRTASITTTPKAKRLARAAATPEIIAGRWSDTPDPAAPAHGSERRRRLNGYGVRVHCHLRRAVQSAADAGVTMVEIARRLGRPTDRVRSWYRDSRCEVMPADALFELVARPGLLPAGARDRLVREIAADAGYLAIPAPRGEGQEQLVAGVLAAMRAMGELADSVRDATADGTITAGEWRILRDMAVRLARDAVALQSLAEREGVR